MSSKRIADLPVKNPIDAMKIPTGGFGDYAITLKILSDWLVNKYSLATKEELANLQVLLLEKIDEEFKKLDVYTKGETDTLIRNVKESLESEIAKLSTRVSENKTRLDNLGTTSKYSVETLPTSKPTEDFVKKSISDLKLGTASKKSIEFFAEQEKQADKVILGNGRTVESNLSDNPNPIDFGAKGDGVADDTRAFTDFEKSVQGREIDLLGKTYFVDRPPIKNTYINGFFKVGESKIPSNGDLLKHKKTNENFKSGLFDKSATALYSWYTNTSWMYGWDQNSAQSIVFDEKNRFIYVMYETKTNGISANVIYRLPMDRGQHFTEALWASGGERRIPHQGMALETTNSGATCLWTGKRNDTALPETTDQYASCRVLRLPIDDVPSFSTASGVQNEWTNENAIYFRDVQEYVLWDLHLGEWNTQPTISYDQKYLIAVAFIKDESNVNKLVRVRVFDLKMLADGGAGDYSNKYLHEFTVPTATYDAEKGVSIQGMASDGVNLYFWGGHTYFGDEDASQKLQVYTLSGEYVAGVTAGDLGYSDSLYYTNKLIPNKENYLFENQSINFLTVNGAPKLTLHVTNGTQDTYRTNIVYAMNLKGGMFRGDDQSPALTLGNFYGGLDLAFQSTADGKIGSISPKGVQQENILISDNKVRLGSGNLNKLSVTDAGVANTTLFGNNNFVRYDDSAAQLRMSFLRTRSTDLITTKPLQANDYIVSLSGYGDDGSKTNFASSVGILGASIQMRVTGEVSEGKLPTSILFGTKDDTGTYAIRWRIEHNGSFVPNYNNAYDFGSPSAFARATYTKKVVYIGNVFDAFGTGSPEGVVVANVGSTYRRADGGANTTFYVKESGSGNTGWVAK